MNECSQANRALSIWKAGVRMRDLPSVGGSLLAASSASGREWHLLCGQWPCRLESQLHCDLNSVAAMLFSMEGHFESNFWNYSAMSSSLPRSWKYPIFGVEVLCCSALKVLSVRGADAPQVKRSFSPSAAQRWGAEAVRAAVSSLMCGFQLCPKWLLPSA